MLCNSDFSERLGGWESVILVVLSVEGPRSEYRTIHDIMVLRGRSCSEYRTIHDFTVQRGRSPLGISNHPRFHGSAWKVPARKPSQSGRSEPTAELAQPALSSRRAYIPAALTPDRPSTHLVTQYPPIQDMRLKSEGLSWRCLLDNDLVTFTCTSTLSFCVPVGHVGGADGHISFPLGHPGCPTMPSEAGPPAR